MRISVPSFAKINWWLEILGRRSDGFHEVRTILQTVDLPDYLHFSPRPAGIAFESAGRPVEGGEENLVVKAANLLASLADPSEGIEICLEKKIPLGAGLGGGSSNAAITLLALNRLWNCGLSHDELAGIGSRLGSDVPFFLTGGTALGLGRGERLVRCKEQSSQLPILLAFPGFGVSTRRAYSLLRSGCHETRDLLTTDAADTTIRRFYRVMGNRDWGALRNDFERPVFEEFPQLREFKEILIHAGCAGVMLSGSGSTLFAVADAETLKIAERELHKWPEAETFRCRSLAHHDYWEALQQAGIEFPS